MCRRLARIATLRKQDEVAEQIVRGFHIEGPFLNEQPGYIGAHPAEYAIPAEADAMRRLLEAAQGMTRIVTLGVEQLTLSSYFLLSAFGGGMRENAVHFKSVSNAVKALRQGEIAAVLGPRGEIEGPDLMAACHGDVEQPVVVLEIPR